METLPSNVVHLPITLRHLENIDLPPKTSNNQLNINSKNPKKSNEYLHFSVKARLKLLPKVLIRLLKARLKVLLKVLTRLLKARLKVLLKVLIRLLKARLKVLLKILIRLLRARLKVRGRVALQTGE